MSGGFSFPPPPPPPPKPAGGSSGPEYGSQNRGGRGRGRGRGGINRRGDGSVGGGRAYNGGANGYSAGHQRGGNSNNMNYYTSHQQHQAPERGSFSPGTYNNPNFKASPGFEGHVASHSQPHHEISPHRPSSFPPRTHAGHKRKLDALRPPPEERKKQGPQTAPSVPSFGSPILPPKPVPSTQEKQQSKNRNHSNALGLTPGNHGQQQQQEDYSDEEGEDVEVDEEAMYAELGSKMTFEHNGVVLSLNSEADLAAWRDERRKKWPTKARMAEKDAEKRRIGEQRRRLLASAAVLVDDNEGEISQRSQNQRDGQKSSPAFAHEQSAGAPVRSSQSATQGARPESALEKARRELAEQTKMLDQLRKNVAAGEASLAKLRAEHDDENLVATNETVARYGQAAVNSDDTKTGMEKSDDSDASSGVLSESSVLTSDSEAVASGDDGDDGPPEEVSNKGPAPAFDAGTGAVQLPRCRYYAASGYCRDGDSCRFRHELKPGVKPAPQPPVQQQKRDPYQPKLDYSATAEKKTIYQRLMEQQEEEEDRLALQVIKHLGKKGFFDEEHEGRQAP
ncbi:hypothetical protein KC340_g3451 [Hortaea werneckii]|nr:hypothetical protein KC342_g3300 [Hortaea werneckii]KAI7106076.1 hypothetical protein KC339_g3362 [Hortaea werneckii]KAI7243985.1 hypothetical protein KC365_g1829 [Hortaea werneckii]KAI7332289.1 hypothetical protein KC340_g3451 [Hortaea werneckii]KAI7381036.1 hypothetical protein KC328_g12465 [Hortaea werneckii]